MHLLIEFYWNAVLMLTNVNKIKIYKYYLIMVSYWEEPSVQFDATVAHFLSVKIYSRRFALRYNSSLDRKCAIFRYHVDIFVTR